MRNEITYKLTKKLLLQEGQKEIQWISTIYLNKEEYEVLNLLPGKIIKKNRYSFLDKSGLIIGIDEIDFGNQKLWIAEVEFEDEEEMKQFTFSLDYEREITNENGFAGHELANRFDQNYK